MSIQAPQGILNIPNATLRVGKLSVDEVVGADTILNTVARNTILLVDDVAYHENKNWALKLPNAWAGEFECNTASAGNYSEFNFYNEGASSNAQGYNLTFNDTTVEFRYDGSLLKTGTLASTVTGTGVRKVRLMFERNILSVTVDGTLVFTYTDTSGPRPRVYSTTAGGFLNFFTNGGAIKNLKIVNEKWMSDGTSNIAYVGGGEVAVGKALAFNRVSNVSQIKVDSNVVTEYTGPHDRPLREYPEINMTAATTGGYTASASIENNTTTHAAFNAFTSEGFNRWQNGGTRYDTNSPFLHTAGESTTDTDGTSHLGDWIQLQLPNKINLSRIRFSQHSSAPNYQPKSYVVLGSNDDTSWKLIHTQTNLPEASANTNYKAEDTFMTVGYYKYLRLVVKSLQTSTNQIIILRLQYYGHEEGSGSLDTTLKSVYNVPATTGTQLEVYYDAKDLVDGAVSTASGAITGLGGTTINGTAFGDPQVSNGAFVFDGAGDYISATYPSVAGDNIITMSAWILATGTGSGGSSATPIYLGNSYGSNSIGIDIYESGTVYWYMAGGSHINFTNSPKVPLTVKNQWFHVTGTYQTINSVIEMKFYVNGEDVSSYGTFVSNGSLSLVGNDTLYIGKRAGVTSMNWNGSIANFRLYSKVLNADQVKELYDYQKDYFLGSKSQVTLYKGHLGVGVTEPSGQLELAGDERIQEYPPRAMTGYETLVEGHGVFCASSSDEFDTAGSYSPWKAFTKSTSTFFITDHSPATYNSDGTPTAAAGTFEGVSGSWLKLKLPYDILLKRINLARRNDQAEYFSTAILYGSVDDTSWDVLHNIQMPTSYTNVDFEINATKVYKYFVVQITKGAGITYQNIGEWRLFGTPGPTTLDKGSLTLGRSLDVPRISRYDVDTETPRPEKLVVDFDTNIPPFNNQFIEDKSGRGNDGIPYGNATYSAADKAFVFDGTGDYIQGNLNNTGDTDFTVSCWFKRTADDGVETVWFIGGTSSDNPGNGTGLDINTLSDTRGYFYFYSGYELADSGLATVIGLNKWVHLVCTRVGNTMKLYLNGEDRNKPVGGSSPHGLSLDANSEFRIGQRNSSGTNPAHGMVSNFKIYNVALEPSEVKKLYNLGRTGRSMILADTSLQIGAGLHDSINTTGGPRAHLDVHGSILASSTIHGMSGNFHKMLGYGRGGGQADHHRADNCLTAMGAMTTSGSDSYASVGFIIRKSSGYMPFVVEVYHSGVDSDSSDLFGRRAVLFGSINNTTITPVNGIGQVSGVANGDVNDGIVLSASARGDDHVLFNVSANKENRSYGTMMCRLCYYYGIKGRQY